MVSALSGWPYYRGFSEKNIQDTCCIDIKTKADKDEEVGGGKKYEIALYSTRVKHRKKD